MLHVDVYESQFVAKKASDVGEQRLNDGGRVLLPAMVLDDIHRMTMVYPLQFKLSAHRQKPVWAGVLEFSAELGTIILPDWMFEQLKLRDEAIVRLQTCSLGPGSIIKLQPHEKAFVMLQDPRRVLEQHLVNYPVLTKGSTIVINYARRSFRIDVVDIQSAQGNSMDALLTARADSQATELKVDFERPLDCPPSPTEDDRAQSTLAGSPTGSNVIGGSAGGGVQFTPFAFKPPTLTNGSNGAGAAPAVSSTAGEETAQSQPAFVPFAGAGRKLNGESAPPPGPPQPLSEDEQRKVREKRLQAFAGKGHSLR